MFRRESLASSHDVSLTFLPVFLNTAKQSWRTKILRKCLDHTEMQSYIGPRQIKIRTKAEKSERMKDTEGKAGNPEMPEAFPVQVNNTRARVS